VRIIFKCTLKIGREGGELTLLAYDGVMAGCHGHGIHKIQVISCLVKAVLASQ